MKKLTLLLCAVTAIALASVPSFATDTCPIEGEHVSGAGSVSSTGGRATVAQQAVSGCWINITYIKANLTSAAAGTAATLGVYIDQNCNTLLYPIATSGVPNNSGQVVETVFDSGGAPVIARVGATNEPYICIGWDSGHAGVIESVYWSGYFTGIP